MSTKARDIAKAAGPAADPAAEHHSLKEDLPKYSYNSLLKF
jgi:hypothetical protein